MSFTTAKAQNKNLSYNYIPTITKMQSSLMKTDSLSYFRPSIMNQKYNVNQLPFFCKMEELISRQSKMNFRFRIGSLDYVNKMEYGK